MKEYNFDITCSMATSHAKNNDFAEFAETLAVAMGGEVDFLLSYSPNTGVNIFFDREASSLQDAVASAIHLIAANTPLEIKNIKINKGTE